MTAFLRTIAGFGFGWLVARLMALLARFQSGPHNSVAKKTSRRTFTRNAALGATGVVLAELGIGFVQLLWPNKTGAFGGKVTIPASQIPEPNGEPYKYTPGKFFLVHTEDGLEALYWKCVHLGCTVPWIANEERFHCPCHGSIYFYNGTLESGPAPRALDAMPITVNDDGSVQVDTNPGSLIVRDEYRAEDAAPYPVK